MENQGSNGDNSRSDPHPEVGHPVCQSRHSIDSDTDEAHDMVTGVTEETHEAHDIVTGITGEIRQGPHMVTRGPEEIRQYSHMMTETQEEIPYCSLSTSSGKQKKARSTSQPQFRSENPLRQLKQTRYCWPLNNWQRTVIQPISTAISV